MTPAKIKPYIKAYNMRQQSEDTNMWMQGQYFYAAMNAVVEQTAAALSKKKSSVDYPKEPLHILMEKERQAQNLSEEEKRRQTEALFMRLKVMQSNFERKKAEEEGVR